MPRHCFAEARALASRMEKLGGSKDEVCLKQDMAHLACRILGPLASSSTTMVRHAYEALTGQKHGWYAF